MSNFFKIFLLLVIFGPILSHAADETSLQEIVITGTKTEKTVLETPIRTEVISKDVIQKQHAKDLGESLQYLPGVLTSAIHGRRGTSVTLQGMNEDQVLVLVDGQPLSPISDSFVDISQLAVSNIQKIEIIKGASSSLYGSSAMGGVINIITQQRTPKTQYNVRIQQAFNQAPQRENENGENKPQQTVSAQFTKAHEYVSYGLNTDLRQFAGYDYDKNSFSSDGETGSRKSFGGSLNIKPTPKLEIKFRPDIYQEKLHVFRGKLNPTGDTTKMQSFNNTSRQRYWFETEYKHDDGLIKANYLRENFKDQMALDDLIQTPYKEIEKVGTYQIDRTELQWSHNIQKHLLTSGIVFQKHTMDRDNIVNSSLQTSAIVPEVQNKSQSTTEMYLQDDIKITEKIELVPGVRAQQDSQYGEKYTPKVSLKYSPGLFESVTTNLRASVGTGYRVPNLRERYYLLDHSAFGYKVLGNENLKPETSVNYQLGLEFAHKYGTKFEINGFLNKVTDLISTATAGQTAGGITNYQYLNINRAEMRGYELSLKRDLIDTLQAQLNYVYLEAIDLQTNNLIPLRPLHSGGLNFTYSFGQKGSNILLGNIYRGKQYNDAANSVITPAWVKTDLRINLDLAQNTFLEAGISNLFDKHRSARLDNGESVDGRPQEGRLFYLGLRFNG